MRNPLLPLSSRLALNTSPPASQSFGRPCGPSQNRRESEWDLKEESRREVALSLPELSEIKPSQESFPLWMHTCRFTQRIALAVMATLDSHTAGCVIMTVKCSLSLTVDFTSPSTCDGARSTPTHSIVWQSAEHFFFSCLHPSFSLLFLIAFLSVEKSVIFEGYALYNCAACLHVFSFVSGCCLFCSLFLCFKAVFSLLVCSLSGPITIWKAQQKPYRWYIDIYTTGRKFGIIK